MPFLSAPLAPARGAPATYWVWIDQASGQARGYNTRTGATEASAATTGAVLSTLLGTLGSTSATISLSPQTHTLSAPLSVPATVALVVPQGAILAHGANTLTINGPLQAGAYQIWSGAGTVTLGRGAVERVYPEWWGVTGTGDEVPINAALLCAYSGGTPACGVVQLQAKTYHTLGTINAQASIALQGSGSSVFGNTAATSVQSTNSAAPVITLPGNGPVFLRDFDAVGGLNNIATPAGGSSLVFVSRLHCSSATAEAIIASGSCERWFFDDVTITGCGGHGIWFQHDVANNYYLDKCHFKYLQVARPGGSGIRIECKGYNNTFEQVNITQTGQHAWHLDNVQSRLLILNSNHESTGITSAPLCQTTGSISSGSNQLTLDSLTEAQNLSVGDTVTVVGAASADMQALTATVSAIAGTTITLSTTAGNTVSGVYVTNALYDEFYLAGTIANLDRLTIINSSGGHIDSGTWANRVRFMVNNRGCASGVLLNVISLGAAPIYDPQGYLQLVGSSGPTGKRTMPNGSAGVLGQSNLADDDLWINVRGGKSGQVRLQSDSSLGYGDWTISKVAYNANANTARPTLFQIKGADGTLRATRVVPLNGVYSIPAGTTTPDVSQSDRLITANGSATTITGFSNASYAGQRITLIFGDGNTTVQHGTNIWLAAGANYTGALHKALDLVYSGSYWVEPGGSA